MKTQLLNATIAATVLFAGQLNAGVRVSDTPAAPEVEKSVAFRTPDNSYITSNPGHSLDLSGKKIGSKQKFWLIDINGNKLEDGDEVKIRYTPNTDGKPDPSKASYWVEVKGGVKRGKDGDAFKIKVAENKYKLQAPSGNFVHGAAAQGVLSVTNATEDALQLEIIDISAPTSATQAP